MANVMEPFAIDYSMYKEIRSNVIDMLNGNETPKHGIALLKGGEQETRYEADTDHLFRQDSKFKYLFGVKEPDCYALIETDSKKTVLFVPNFPDDYGVWMGPIVPREHFKEVYQVDEVLFVEELPKYIAEFKPEVIYVTKGENSDSGKIAQPATFEGIENYNVDDVKLFECITECRVFKTDKEMEIFRYVGRIGSQAHLDNMAALKPEMYEYQIESTFTHSCYYKGGCRKYSFIPISASGRNSSTLHYGHAGAPNNRKMHDGDWILMDMGCEYDCYACDITTVCPVNGKFDEKQKFIYETVLEMNRSCQKMMKPGVNWRDVHLNANRVLLTRMKEAGMVNGDIDEMMKVNLAGYFMPHGLGHFMGIDVHDVGGFTKGMERDKSMGLRSLRTKRDLQERMLITVEPGMYFVDYCMGLVKADEKMNKFMNWEKVMEYYPIGGCRIECDCYITADGCEDITPAPRTVEQIEKAYAGEITSIDQITSFL